MKQTNFLSYLTRRINKAFDIQVSKKKPRKDLQSAPKSGMMYESIEDYTKQTGKRFRMTKAETVSGLTREEAFNQRYGKRKRK